MASVPKKKSRLGAPPKQDDVLNNLAEPETAPSPTQSVKVDGRTMRKTGMTEQLNTRVSKEFRNDLKAVARSEGRTIGKILELSLDAYKEKLGQETQNG